MHKGSPPQEKKVTFLWTLSVPPLAPTKGLRTLRGSSFLFALADWYIAHHTRGGARVYCQDQVIKVIPRFEIFLKRHSKRFKDGVHKRGNDKLRSPGAFQDIHCFYMNTFWREYWNGIHKRDLQSRKNSLQMWSMFFTTVANPIFQFSLWRFNYARFLHPKNPPHKNCGVWFVKG